MINFHIVHPRGTWDHLGFIPDFLSEDDPRSAKEQFNINYAHGGGWSPYPQGKWKVVGTNRFGPIIKYPGDPKLEPIGVAKLHDETIIVYESGITAIFQKDGSFEVARLD